MMLMQRSIAALQAGAVSLVVPKQKPWGQKVGYVRDLDGILYQFNIKLHRKELLG